MVMTALLTLGAMLSSQSNFTPQISYTTKLDHWMVTCISFVFAALMELVFVLLMKKRREESKLADAQDSSQVSAFVNRSEVKDSKNIPKMECSGAKYLDPATYDTICFTIFLALFLLFTLIYWVDLVTL